MRAGNITPDLTTLWNKIALFFTFVHLRNISDWLIIDRNHLAVIYTHVCFLQWRELRWKVTSGSNWRINCSVNFRLPIAEHKWFYTTHYNFLGAPALPRCRPSLNELLIMSRVNERAWLELMRRSRRAAGQTRTGVFVFYSSCVSDIRESPSDCSSDAGLNTSLHVCIKTHTEHL